MIALSPPNSPFLVNFLVRLVEILPLRPFLRRGEYRHPSQFGTVPVCWHSPSHTDSAWIHINLIHVICPTIQLHSTPGIDLTYHDRWSFLSGSTTSARVYSNRLQSTDASDSAFGFLIATCYKHLQHPDRSLSRSSAVRLNATNQTLVGFPLTVFCLARREHLRPRFIVGD